VSNMPRWQNFNLVYAKRAIHRYVTSPIGQKAKHAKMAKFQSGIRQEGYTHRYMTSPRRQNVRHAQDGKTYSGKHPRRLYTGKKKKKMPVSCQVRTKYCVLNPKLGDCIYRYKKKMLVSWQVRTKYCVLNPKPGDWLCRFVFCFQQSFALRTAFSTRNSGTGRMYI
jgi:hypothetical protein